MPIMKDADKHTMPTKRKNGEKTPLVHMTAKKPGKDDHFNVGGTEKPHAYWTGGFGYNGENANEPGDGPTPHRMKQGLTTDQREPRPHVSESDADITHPGKVMHTGIAKKVTPNSKYPYQGNEISMVGEDPSREPDHSGLRVMVWHMGIDGESEGAVHDTTWAEFLNANDFDPTEIQKILNTILSGKTYHENLGAGGIFGIKMAEAPMKKTNEDAMCGGAVSAGNIGTGSPNALFTSKRLGQDDDSADEPDSEQDDDLEEGQIVEFTRNSVPYRGRIMEFHGNSVIISTAGRRMVVERVVLAGLNGAPEPTSTGPTKYGVKTAKQNHAQSSPTTPNRTMQKFVGASESMGGAFEAQGDEAGGIQSDEVTAPSQWASALINDDYGDLDDREIAQIDAFKKMLSDEGMYVVSDVEGSDRFTNSYHLYNYGGPKNITGGSVCDYVVHVRPTEKTVPEQAGHRINTTEELGDGSPNQFEYMVKDLLTHLRRMKGFFLDPQILPDKSGYRIELPYGDKYLDVRDAVADIRDYAMHHRWRIEKDPTGALIIRPPQPMDANADHFGEALGDRSFNTFAGWWRACKQVASQMGKLPNLKMIGDKDIGEAHIDGKSIGEWDGVKGTIYRNV